MYIYISLAYLEFGGNTSTVFGFSEDLWPSASGEGAVGPTGSGEGAFLFGVILASLPVGAILERLQGSFSQGQPSPSPLLFARVNVKTCFHRRGGLCRYNMR